jgi:hypothetical protein
MKMIFSSLLAFSLISPVAGATELASLDCFASNGVIIKGTAQPGQALKVETQWGMMKQEFAASIANTSTAEKLYVNLDSDKDQHYILDLNANANRLNEGQRVYGRVLRPLLEKGQDPLAIAAVGCDLSLR